MTVISEIKARMRAHIDPNEVDPPNSLRAYLFAIMDSVPHTVRLTYPGVVPSDSMLLGEIFVVDVQFAANLKGARFRCITAPVNAYTVRVVKNGSDVGAIAFPAGGTVATVSTIDGDPVKFEVGDALQLISQSGLDVIAGIFGSLAGRRL